MLFLSVVDSGYSESIHRQSAASNPRWRLVFKVRGDGLFWLMRQPGTEVSGCDLRRKKRPAGYHKPMVNV